MTTPQHTPEKWFVKGQDILSGALPKSGPFHVKDSIGTPVAEVYRKDEVQLIAAAPDLLAALTELTAWVNDIFDWPTYSEDDERLLAWLKESFTEVGARIKEAIAKAEGDVR